MVDIEKYAHGHYVVGSRPYKLPRPALMLCDCCAMVVKLIHRFYFGRKTGDEYEAWVTWCWMCKNSVVVSNTEDSIALLRR